MSLKRKFLMGLAALALPLGTLFVVLTPGVATAAVPADPGSNCSLGLTINWPGAGLSTYGSATNVALGDSTTPKDNAVSISGTSLGGCNPSTPPSLPDIVTKNTACTPTTGAPCPTGTAAKGYYIYGSAEEFANFGLSSGLLTFIKKALTSIQVGDGTNAYTYGLLVKTAGLASDCPITPLTGGDQENGFEASGTIKSSLPAQDKTQTWSTRICLEGDSGTHTTGNFNYDFGTASQNAFITQATADPASSFLDVSSPFPTPPAPVNGSTVTCTKMSVNLTTTQIAEASKCGWANDTAFPKGNAKDWGDITGNAGALASGGVLTWTGGGTLTISAPALGTGTLCPPSSKLSADETATGTVIATSGDNSPAQVGDTFSAEICLYSNLSVKQAPGSSMSL